MTCAAWFRLWLADRSACCKRSTLEAMEIYFFRHIIPALGSYPLGKLSPVILHRYAMEKLKSGRRDGNPGGLPPVSVRKHLSLIRQALDDAVCRGYLRSNPARSVRLPRSKTATVPRTVFLTPAEAQKMLDAFLDHPLRDAVALALIYGLRRSEVLGLKWSAVDFARGTLTVRHTVVKNLTIEASDTVKSATSFRTFALLPEISEMLARRENSPHTGDYIFSRADGGPMRPDSLTRGFQRVLAAHGLPRMRFHDLRHSCASILFDRGWSLEDVKNWLGHADIETTSNIYLHYKRARKVMLAADLEGVFRL